MAEQAEPRQHDCVAVCRVSTLPGGITEVRADFEEMCNMVCTADPAAVCAVYYVAVRSTEGPSVRYCTAVVFSKPTALFVCGLDTAASGSGSALQSSSSLMGTDIDTVRDMVVSFLAENRQAESLGDWDAAWDALHAHASLGKLRHYTKTLEP